MANMEVTERVKKPQGGVKQMITSPVVIFLIIITQVNISVQEKLLQTTKRERK